MEDAKATRRELETGILLAAALEMGIGVWIAGNKAAYLLGVLFGALAAVGILWHMYKSLDEALDLDPATAEKYVRKKAVVRLVMMGLAVTAAGLFPEALHPVGVLFGVLALKFSAFLQPLVHKYIFKKKENE